MAKYRKKGCLSALPSLFFWGWLIIMGIGLLGNLVDSFSRDNEPVSTADGFTIEKYNVVLDVKEDNKIYVTEYITVNFRTTSKHGILKFVPQWLEYTGKDEKTIKRKSSVSNLTAVGDPYSTDWVKAKARIKVGSANEYVSLGERSYTINYTYDMGKDPFKDFDEFIFHTFGDYWGTELKNASIQINMPKEFNVNDVSFYTDKYRGINVSNYVDYEVVGNTLYASFNAEEYRYSDKEDYCSDEWNIIDGVCDFPEWRNKELDKSLTVHIELPEGYFVGGSWNYGFGSIAIAIIIFGITALTIRRWYKYGKNFPKKSKTAEFYPPENLSSAEIGYIFGRQPSKKLTISLIVSLASKGYIKIDDLKDKGKNIQITKLIAEPGKQMTLDDMVGKREIEVKKLKESDSALSKKENTMMQFLFKKENTRKFTSNINKFLDVKDKLIRDGYIEILSDNDESRLEAFYTKKVEYEENQKKYEIELEKYNKAISKLQPLNSFERIVYSRLFEGGDVVILSEHKTFYKAFNDVESQLKSKTKDLIVDSKATSKMIWSIVITILVAVLYFVSYTMIEDLDPNWSIVYTLSWVCILINMFFTIFMKRKTEYGEEIISKVKGFRDFLIRVEKSKLEQLVVENPQYFYNILPYTYVLNISKKWIKKFENIQIPEIDMGNHDFDSWNSFSSIYDNVYYPPSSSGSSSSSSGCSSCGGGCSSCGGGCSSCGGGGSW